MQVAFQTISLFLLQGSMHKMPSLTPHQLILLCGSEFQINIVFLILCLLQDHKTKKINYLRNNPFKIHFISILVSTMHLCECHLQNTLKNSLYSTKEDLQFITCVGGLTFDAAAHKNQLILFLSTLGCICGTFVLSVNQA